MANNSDKSVGILDGKVAVITGAGQGIGKACAKVFVREGAKVLAVDFSGAEEKVATELGSAVVPFHADVSKEDEIEAMYAAAIEAFGKVDAALNVAGTQAGRLPEVTMDEYERMTELNLRGVLFSTKHAVKAMKQCGGGGSIVNFSSAGAINAEDRAPIPYSAAKAGVHALTKSYAIQCGADNIRVNVIAVGFTLTELTRQSPPDILREMSAKSVLGRAGEAEEQAEVAAFLASDRSSFVTGAVIPVDGGWSARLA